MEAKRVYVLDSIEGCLEILRHDGARRQGEYVCHEVKTRDGGSGTLHYRRIMTIEDFVNRRCLDRHEHKDLWGMLVLPEVRKAVISYFKIAEHDPAFPLLAADETVIAFDDSLFFVRKRCFVPRARAEKMIGSGSAGTYIAGSVDPDWLVAPDDADIPMPVFSAIMREQGMSVRDVDLFLMLCFARPLFSIGTFDC
jgi:hypothetical protein